MSSDFQTALPAANLNAALRRLFDVTVALAGMLLFLVFLAPVVLAIHLDSPGPILFSQVRLGQHGRPFRLYKFRKFHHGRRAQTGTLAVTLKDDDRMTRVGRILERTKIDEVPQLWNVLRGDMAVVGPRPETQDFADCFEGPYQAVLDHKPGIFGPNQLYFRNECTLYPKNADPHDFYRKVLFPAKARNDLDYFPRRSFGQDIGWILRGLLGLIGIGLPHGKPPGQPSAPVRLGRLRNAPDRPSLPE
ncbi:sugar transferase [Azospirillum doebereinerae]|uniref:Sugar transferase n=1 Tax=Azospirillum doebereinerae TaxID=92933 RepID=A0A3S1CHG5_9PROT|nr:sugar transferase [Azospirillum doebereinerae]MCG5238774.1 sugar transferase [Azospirillum doebereinerae]RUQ72088.1 sugar transferase [Azospirillum doebereinerae]